MFILLIPITAASWAALTLGQDASWDVRNYHFYSGFAFLHKPLNFDFAPAQVQSFLNPIMHVLSYSMLAHLPGKLAAILLAAIQSLNFFLVFRISENLFSNWQSPLRFAFSLSSAATGCYGAVFITELGTTFGDNLSSLLILTGLLLIVKYAQLGICSAGPDRLLWVAGAVLGLAVGIKLTLALYVIATGIALPVVLAHAGRRVRRILLFFGFMAAGFAAAYGFWGWALYREYQNPVFPFFNALFRSPYFDLQNVADERFMPRTWEQKFFYPFFFAVKNNLVSEIEFRDARLALCYIALAALLLKGLSRYFRGLFNADAIFFSTTKSRNVIFFALFFFVSYVLWQYQFSVYRYLIVLELLAPVFVALTLSCFIQSKKWIFFSALVLNVAICIWLIPPDFGRRAFDDQYLRVKIPAIAEIEQSVVLMGGEEATSYIIPSFPASTRFVRIRSNFTYPGRNPKLDEKVRGILQNYDAGHTYVYIAGEFEREGVSRDVNFYGLSINEQSCWAVRTGVGETGMLCATLQSPGLPAETKPSAPVEGFKFVEVEGVKLEVNPEAPVNGDWIQFRLIGIQMEAIDVLYTLNGMLQPAQKNWHLGKDQSIRFPVTAVTPRGWYHFIGIRDSAVGDAGPWTKVDANVQIR